MIYSKTQWVYAGFDFVEFTAPEEGILEPVLSSMGFTKVAKHRSKNVYLWRQGGINMLTNYEPNTPAAFYAREHGPSACAMGFAFEMPQKHLNWRSKKEPEPVYVETGFSELRILPSKGSVVLSCILSTVLRKDCPSTTSTLNSSKVSIETPMVAVSTSLITSPTTSTKDVWTIGQSIMRVSSIFREIRYFDIKGEYTGLVSRALTAPDGLIRIPLNEEKSDKVGQIEEYLREYKGEGIQHIAFSCNNLIECWDRLKACGVEFMSPPPSTYYDMLEERLPGHGEPTQDLRARGILLDGTTADNHPRLLLQIFSEKAIGPIFFEFIQRKEDEGFGEGNFEALFKSIERDQMNRGVL